MRSARVRRLSDQLKPSPDGPEQETGISESREKDKTVSRRRDADESADGARDKPRPLASREEVVPFCAAFFDAGGDLVPFCPGLPPPPPPPPPLCPNEFPRMSLNAFAPKLVRLANGVAGVLPLFGSRVGPSSSAMADSSILPLLAEPMLSGRPRIELKGEAPLGEPERPRVVKERRRRWAWDAAWLIAPGPCWDGGGLLFSFEGRDIDDRPLPNRSAKVWPAKEERRLRPVGDCGWSSDMASVQGRCGEGR